ncbi:hypothetical protein CL618_02510 [archaeon]|nr:hypothetical protein [archaeon]
MEDDYLFQENLAKINDLTKRLQKLSPNDRRDEISIREQLATRYGAAGDYQEAINQLDILERLNPQRAQSYHQQAKEASITEFTLDLV